MKHSSKIMLLVALMLFSSCAYFNIFYNARRYYNLGYEQTKKNRTENPTSGETQNYQKSIEKSATLIQEYPESKWVDDALLLMGKAYYHSQKYMRANRKFIELMTNYPESEFVPEAKLWLAKTKLSLEKFDEAEEDFRVLVRQNLSPELKGEANFFLGQLYNEKEDYERAVESYLVAARNIRKDLRAEAMYNAASNYDSLGIYHKAAETFKAVLKLDPVQELKQDAKFRYSEMRKESGEYEEAIRDFNLMLADQRNKTIFPKIRLEIAECMARMGDTEGALLAYSDITVDEKGAPVAEAYYQMGKLYEDRMNDYDRALDQFKEVKKASTRSIYADSADIMIRDIERFKALNLVIDMGLRGESGQLAVEEEEIEEDTLTVDVLFAKMDSSKSDSARMKLIAEYRGQTFLDSLMEEYRLSEDDKLLPQWAERLRTRVELGGIDWFSWLEDDALPSDDAMQQELVYMERFRIKNEREDVVASDALSSFKVEEVDKNLFYLSELYLFRFGMPDSAINRYNLILREYPESEYAPQALFNLAYISTDIHRDTSGADTAYQRIVENYPDSKFVKWSRKWLGMPEAELSVDAVQQLYLEAESALIDRNEPLLAFNTYESIYRDYPESAWAPKAFYSMGWIYENRLDAQDRAQVVYDSLVSQFPESEFATRVQPKLQAILDEEKRLADEAARLVAEEKARQDSLAAVQDSLVLGDSTLVAGSDSSLVDSLQGVLRSEAEVDSSTVDGLSPPGVGKSPQEPVVTADGEEAGKEPVPIEPGLKNPTSPNRNRAVDPDLRIPQKRALPEPDLIPDTKADPDPGEERQQTQTDSSAVPKMD